MTVSCVTKDECLNITGGAVEGDSWGRGNIPLLYHTAHKCHTVFYVVTHKI